MKKKIERAGAGMEASDPIMLYTILYQYEHCCGPVSNYKYSRHGSNSGIISPTL